MIALWVLLGFLLLAVVIALLAFCRSRTISQLFSKAIFITAASIAGLAASRSMIETKGRFAFNYGPLVIEGDIVGGGDKLDAFIILGLLGSILILLIVCSFVLRLQDKWN